MTTSYGVLISDPFSGIIKTSIKLSEHTKKICIKTGLKKYNLKFLLIDLESKIFLIFYYFQKIKIILKKIGKSQNKGNTPDFYANHLYPTFHFCLDLNVSLLLMCSFRIRSDTYDGE